MCDPVTIIAAAATATQAVGQYKAGKDSKDAYREQGKISLANAKHAKEVATYNAAILRDQAIRLREEQVNRLNEVGGINIGRISETADINLGRLNESAGINISRVLKSTDTNVSRVAESAMINSARIQQTADTNVRRLEKQGDQTIAKGNEDENAVRRIGAETISSQRAFYGARNVVIDTGTPAALQVDTARMARVDALRVRRNYRLQAEAIMDKADDIKREAGWQIGDINRVAAYQISDMKSAAGEQVGDLTRTLGYQRNDINRETGQQVDDISRNLGYDLSDVEYEAVKLDQQAVLTMIQGDAALTAGINQRKAYNNAGSNAFSQGILSSVGTVMSGVDPKWFSSSSAATATG